jgi:hypothetical protein
MSPLINPTLEFSSKGHCWVSEDLRGEAKPLTKNISPHLLGILWERDKARAPLILTFSPRGKEKGKQGAGKGAGFPRVWGREFDKVGEGTL